jgi:hypothetical protein
MWDAPWNNEEFLFPDNLIFSPAHLHHNLAPIDIERIVPVRMEMPMVFAMEERKSDDMVIETCDLDGRPWILDGCNVLFDIHGMVIRIV